jgi:hypothetical protein
MHPTGFSSRSLNTQNGMHHDDKDNANAFSRINPIDARSLYHIRLPAAEISNSGRSSAQLVKITHKAKSRFGDFLRKWQTIYEFGFSDPSFQGLMRG